MVQLLWTLGLFAYTILFLDNDDMAMDTICDEDSAKSLPYLPKDLLSTVEDTIKAWQEVLWHLNDSDTSLQTLQIKGL